MKKYKVFATYEVMQTVTIKSFKPFIISKIESFNQSNMADTVKENTENRSESHIKLNLSEESIDKQIEKDFLDDIDIPENELIEVRNKRIKRYKKIVNRQKKMHGYKCQLCGYSFHMDNGNDYCEAHHIKMLSKDGSQGPENVIILCANHHRMFHYANNNITVGKLRAGERIIKIGEETFNVKFY